MTAQEAQLAVPLDPAAVASARRFTRECLGDWGLTDMAETAALLVSEAVTNAIQHAGTPASLRLKAGGGVLRVEVRDGSAARPAPRHYDATAATGRGLQLIEALAAAWGAEPAIGGKLTWFELDTGGGGASGSAMGSRMAGA